MAVNLLTQPAKLANYITTDTEADGTVEANITASTGVFYIVEIDNTANKTMTFVKMKDATSIANTEAASHWKLPCPASSKISYLTGSGMTFSTGLCFWATSVAQDGVSNNTTVTQTDPTNKVAVKILST